jgi:hypothetical protein
MLIRTWKTEPGIGVDESKPVNATFSNTNADISLSIVVNEGTGIRKPVVCLWLAPIRRHRKGRRTLKIQ